MVRLGKLTDISDICAYAKGALQTTNLGGFPFNAVIARRVVKQYMVDPDSRVWVVEHKGRIRGVLIATVGEMPFTHFTCATDLAFLADREGAGLLDAFVAWCTLRKVGRIDMGISAGPDREEAVERMFASRGFTRSGSMFHLNLVHGD